MSAPLSVIIPTWNAAARLGPCLAGLGTALFDGLIAEVILADGGSDDAIAAVAEGVGARLVTAPRGRGSQLAAGAAAARGAWLMFLHADTSLAPGWGAAVARHIARAPDRAGYFRLAFDAQGFAPAWVAGWANLRSRVFALPYGDQGLVVSAALYAAVGGHPPWPLMEDVALARRLGRRRLAPIDAVATTSADRYRRHGWWAQGARNLGTLARYGLGVSPDRLALRYDDGVDG